MGCGTRLLAAAFAGAGRIARGVDTSAPMLGIARARDGGESVGWVHADARTVRQDQRFDGIV